MSQPIAVALPFVESGGKRVTSYRSLKGGGRSVLTEMAGTDCDMVALAQEA